MPETLNLEDEFLQLLTEALRAGPGSPEWRQAVSQLQKKHGDQRDEFALLCQAREHLESGKSYRSVVAGPGFTRKVLAGIEDEDNSVAAKVHAPPTANLVAFLSVIVLIAIVGLIAYFLLPGGGDPNRTAIDDLDKIYFPTVATIGFQGGIPTGWQRIGPLQLDTTRDLRPAPTTQPVAAGDIFQGGGAMLSAALPPGEPVAFEVSILAPQLGHDLSVQVFVTDDPKFSEDRATAAHELVWLLQGDQSTVFLPNNRPAGPDTKLKASPDPFTVRVVMNRDIARIDAAGSRLFAGLHQLSPDKPRYVGVRFVRIGPKPVPVAFTSVKVQKPQATR